MNIEINLGNGKIEKIEDIENFKLMKDGRLIIKTKTDLVRQISISEVIDFEMKNN